VRDACIQRHRHAYAIALMCRTLEVRRSGFYAWQRRRPAARARAEQRLRVAGCAVHQSSKQRFGSPRVHAKLQAQGVRVGRKRVERRRREEAQRVTKSVRLA